MKKYLLSLTIITVISCSKSSDLTCIPSSLNDNVIAFYPFSNGSLNDQSGAGHNLINQNTVLFGADRNNNASCAAKFDQMKKQFFKTDGNFTNEMQNKSLSISMWYRPEGSIGGYELLMGRSLTDKISCPDKYGEWSLGLYDCRKAVGSINQRSVWAEKDLIWLDTTALGLNKCNIEFENNSNVWKHIVFTYSNDQRKLYINGVLQNTQQGSGCGIDSKNQGDLFIGKFYTGYIDDVILFDKELTQADVKNLFNMEACCE